MNDNEYLDLSDVIETLSVEENMRVLDNQLQSLHDDVCEVMIDNFKILYQRYTSVINSTGMQDPDTVDQVKTAFFQICDNYIDHIADEFGMTVDDCYLDLHYGDLPSIALQFYLFFVLDLRSNLYNVLLTYISSHTKELASMLEQMKPRKDSITEVNRRMEDQEVAIIASNIYDVVDWIMENLDVEEFFEYMERDYIALAPMERMIENGNLNGDFTSVMGTILKENLQMKGRICFDIICKLKGYQMS